MRILHVVDVKNPNGNGVVVAVNEYARHEAKLAEVAIYNLGTKFSSLADVPIYHAESFRTISDLPNDFARPDIVVFNEVYKWKYLELARECRKRKIPYIIIPHGSITKHAQRQKSFKKKIANMLFFNRFIRNATAVQFLNQKERDGTRIKYKKAIISGNGIDTKKVKLSAIPKEKSLVYIGRYDKHVKGLDLLIDVCKNNAAWFRKNKVRVLLYGRDSVNTRDELAAEINRADIADIMQINGELYGREKETVLTNSYAFVQVSRHEGQPMGIMEALSYGLPCIITYGTSFGEYVNENKCGIGINFNKDELFAAIKTMFEDEKLRNKYSKNTKVVKKDFSWSQVAEKCIDEYQGLL